VTGVSTQTQRLIGVGAVLVAIVALLAHNALNLPVDESPHFERFFNLSLVCVGVGAAIFLVALPAAEAAPDASRRLARGGFLLSLLALASMLFFFTGLPFVLGAGAFVLGELGEERAADELAQAGGEPRKDETQQKGESAFLETFGAERASLAWAGALTGGLVFVACLALFAIVVIAR
jgi:hypothetical protein